MKRRTAELRYYPTGVCWACIILCLAQSASHLFEQDDLWWVGPRGSRIAEEGPDETAPQLDMNASNDRRWFPKLGHEGF